MIKFRLSWFRISLFVLPVFPKFSPAVHVVSALRVYSPDLLPSSPLSFSLLLARWTSPFPLLLFPLSRQWVNSSSLLFHFFASLSSPGAIVPSFYQICTASASITRSEVQQEYNSTAASPKVAVQFPLLLA